jgi:hypothetical protein
MEQPRLTRELLENEQLSIHDLLRACREGQWERVRRGAYARPEGLDDRARHLRLVAATVPLLAPESVLSHASAAALHGLPIRRDLLDRVWVTRADGGHGRHGPVLHLRLCRLEEDEIVNVGGVRVTSLERTAIDMARLLSPEWGLIFCDAALVAGANKERLLGQVDRARGWPGARKALCAAEFSDGRSGSPLESVSRLQLQRLGFPTPVLQFEVVLNGVVVATTDFGWEDEGLVGECDGKVKYDELLRPGETAADAVMREKRREERIRGADLWIVRWGWSEAWNPPELRRIVQTGFALAPRNRSRAGRSA